MALFAHSYLVLAVYVRLTRYQRRFWHGYSVYPTASASLLSVSPLYISHAPWKIIPSFLNKCQISTTYPLSLMSPKDVEYPNERGFMSNDAHPSTLVSIHPQALKRLGSRSTGKVSRDLTLYPLSDVNAGSHPPTSHYIVALLLYAILVYPDQYPRVISIGSG